MHSWVPDYFKITSSTTTFISGWVISELEWQHLRVLHERAFGVGFKIRSCDKSNRAKRERRLYLKHPSIPEIGHPFHTTQTTFYTCQYKPNSSKNKVQKNGELAKRSTECPAKIVVRRLIIYTGYKLPSNATINQKNKIRSEVQEDLRSNSDIEKESRLYVTLPFQTAHSNHPFNSNKPVIKTVKEKQEPGCTKEISPVSKEESNTQLLKPTRRITAVDDKTSTKQPRRENDVKRKISNNDAMYINDKAQTSKLLQSSKPYKMILKNNRGSTNANSGCIILKKIRVPQSNIISNGSSVNKTQTLIVNKVSVEDVLEMPEPFATKDELTELKTVDVPTSRKNNSIKKESLKSFQDMKFSRKWMEYKDDLFSFPRQKKKLHMNTEQMNPQFPIQSNLEIPLNADDYSYNKNRISLRESTAELPLKTFISKNDSCGSGNFPSFNGIYKEESKSNGTVFNIADTSKHINMNKSQLKESVITNKLCHINIEDIKSLLTQLKTSVLQCNDLIALRRLQNRLLYVQEMYKQKSESFSYNITEDNASDMTNNNIKCKSVDQNLSNTTNQCSKKPKTEPAKCYKQDNLQIPSMHKSPECTSKYYLKGMLKSPIRNKNVHLNIQSNIGSDLLNDITSDVCRNNPTVEKRSNEVKKDDPNIIVEDDQNDFLMDNILVIGNDFDAEIWTQNSESLFDIDSCTEESMLRDIDLDLLNEDLEDTDFDLIL